MTTYDTNIAKTVLHSVVEAIASGSLSQLSVRGIDDKVARELSNLSAHQFAELVRSATRAVRIEINEDQLRCALTHVQSESRKREIEDELLRLDASLPAMRELFGWSNYKYAARRQSLGIKTVGGRPRIPTREEEDQILHAWNKHAELPVVERLLATAMATNISVAVIWPYLLPMIVPPAPAVKAVSRNAGGAQRATCSHMVSGLGQGE